MPFFKLDLRAEVCFDAIKILLTARYAMKTLSVSNLIFDSTNC